MLRELRRQFVADGFLVISNIERGSDSILRCDQLDTEPILFDPPAKLREIDEHARDSFVFISLPIDAGLVLRPVNFAPAQLLKFSRLPGALVLHDLFSKRAKTIQNETFDTWKNLADHGRAFQFLPWPSLAGKTQQNQSKHRLESFLISQAQRHDRMVPGLWGLRPFQGRVLLAGDSGVSAPLNLRLSLKQVIKAGTTWALEASEVRRREYVVLPCFSIS